MSFLGSGLDFEKFQLSDIWKKIKKDPERLFIGAIDPWSTKMWNSITKNDYEPLVDQLGGPYGGHTFSAFGNQDGGVYQRAEAAGIDTQSSKQLHDVAHAIAGSYAGGYGAGQLGLGGGAASGTGNNAGLWDQAFSGSKGFGGAEYGASPAGGIPGIGGAVGGGTGNAPALNMNAMKAMGSLPMPQPPPQQMPPPQQNRGNPAMSPSQGVAGLGRRAGTGVSNALSRMSEMLFPLDPMATQGMSPEQIKAMRSNAMLNMGLGMMAAANKGGRFGESAFAGLGQAQNNIQGAMQQGYQNARAKQADERDQSQIDRQIERDKVADQRYQSQQQTEMERQRMEQERWQAEQESTRAWRETQAKIDREQMQTQRDLTEVRERETAKAPNYRDIDRLRAEFNTRKQKVSDSGNFADQIIQLSANQNIKNDPSAQTAMVFAFGKMLDPDSVVREAEYRILEQSRGLQEQLQAFVPRLQTGARLTPQQLERMVSVARQFAGKNKERIGDLSQYYNELAGRRSIDPFEVTGQTPGSQSDPNVIDVGAGQPTNSRGPGLGQTAPVIRVDY